jgi:Pin2-interacting protein X1
MLLSQGWIPGTNLGATNAPHTHLCSDGSASHIRVVRREDNLGLGAKHGSGISAGECTGLSVFQDLLGRLNGKSEAVLEKEQKSRDEVKRTLYAERRWGGLRFVHGGMLIGDTIQEGIEGETEKLEGKSMAVNEDTTALRTKPKRRGGRARSKLESSALQSGTEDGTTGSEAMDRLGLEPQTDNTRRSTATTPSGGLGSEKAQRKAEKARRKVDRRSRKKAKRTEQSGQPVAEDIPTPSQGEASDGEASDAEPHSVSMAPASRSAVSAGGRHAVRQRYIMQKRLAVTDAKSLNEVCGRPRCQRPS